MHPDGVSTAYALKELIESKYPLANRIDCVTQTQVDIITSRHVNPSPDETYPLDTPEDVDNVLKVFGISIKELCTSLENTVPHAITDTIKKTIREEFNESKKKQAESTPPWSTQQKTSPSQKAACPLCYQLGHDSYAQNFIESLSCEIRCGNCDQQGHFSPECTKPTTNEEIWDEIRFQQRQGLKIPAPQDYHGNGHCLLCQQVLRPQSNKILWESISAQWWCAQCYGNHHFSFYCTKPAVRGPRWNWFAFQITKSYTLASSPGKQDPNYNFH